MLGIACLWKVVAGWLLLPGPSGRPARAWPKRTLGKPGRPVKSRNPADPHPSSRTAADQVWPPEVYCRALNLGTAGHRYGRSSSSRYSSSPIKSAQLGHPGAASHQYPGHRGARQVTSTRLPRRAACHQHLGHLGHPGAAGHQHLARADHQQGATTTPAGVQPARKPSPRHFSSAAATSHPPAPLFIR